MHFDKFSIDQKNEISTGFLGLIPVKEASGETENIFSLIDEEIRRSGQTLINCIKFALDSVLNMVGCNSYVWSRLKDVSPSWLQLKGICHSLALCIQNAVSKLPSNIGLCSW